MNQIMTDSLKGLCYLKPSYTKFIFRENEALKKDLANKGKDLASAKEEIMHFKERPEQV